MGYRSIRPLTLIVYAALGLFAAAAVFTVVANLQFMDVVQDIRSESGNLATPGQEGPIPTLGQFRELANDNPSPDAPDLCGQQPRSGSTVRYVPCIPRSDLIDAEDARAQAKLAILGTLLLTAAAFLFWLHRAYSNLPGLGGTVLDYTPRSALLWWFVPIFSFFRPHQVMSEVWQQSSVQERSDERRWGALAQERVPRIFMVWWILFIVAIVLGPVFGTLFEGQASDLFAAILFRGGREIFATVLLAIDSVLLVVVMRQIVTRQETRAAIIAQQAASPPEQPEAPEEQAT